MRFPEWFDVLCTDERGPSDGAWIACTVRMSAKNDYSSFHGPANAGGIVHVEWSSIQEDAERDANFAIMDYIGLAGASGTILIEGLDLERAERGVRAIGKFRKYVSYRPDFESGLSRFIQQFGASGRGRISTTLESSADTDMNFITI